MLNDICFYNLMKKYVHVTTSTNETSKIHKQHFGTDVLYLTVFIALSDLFSIANVDFITFTCRLLPIDCLDY